MESRALESPEVTIAILIVDDHDLMRDLLTRILSTEQGFRVVGEAAHGNEALSLASRLHPDVVVLDIDMPDMDGIEVTRHLKREDPQVKVLILTAHGKDEYVVKALSAGASGYLLKTTAYEKLAHAIRTVYHGEAILDPKATTMLIHRFLTPDPQLPSPPTPLEQRLSQRELEILVLVAQGKSNREIASGLVLSENTVKRHVASIMGKLEIHDRLQLALFARGQRLV